MSQDITGILFIKSTVATLSWMIQSSLQQGHLTVSFLFILFLRWKRSFERQTSKE